MSIFRPDNFADDPVGHVKNQTVHMVIGLALWLVGAVIWPGWGEGLALVIGVAYFLIWEWGVQRLKLFWDSVEDACHITFGPVIGMALHHGGPLEALGAFSAWATVLGFGMWRRW